MLKFTEDHEWLRVHSDQSATIGITAYAADKLGELVFVDLPEIGRRVKKGDEVVVVESCKAASDVYAPVDGEVIAVNDELTQSPNMVNTAPMEAGWLFKIKLSRPSQVDGLMDEKTYSALVE